MREFINTKIGTLFSFLLGCFSIFMILHGYILFENTSSVVQSTEFGMLITVANEISLIIIWLAIFGLWCLTKDR